MSRLRLLFAWLLMAAVPMQGFAAASMLYCGTAEAQHGWVQVQPMAAAHMRDAPVVGSRSAHDHAAHAYVQPDRTAIVHAATGHVVSAASEPVAGARQAPGADQPSPDGAHKCSVCAACCNSAAIFEVPHVVAMAPGPQAEPAEPFVRIHARATPVPDKPPRA